MDLILALSSLRQLCLLEVGSLFDPQTGLKRLESHCSLEEIQVDGADVENVPSSVSVDTGLLALSAFRVISIILKQFSKVSYHCQYLKGVLAVVVVCSMARKPAPLIARQRSSLLA